MSGTVQASGANARFLIDFEKAYRVPPDTKAGKVMPFNPGLSVAPQQKANAPATILSGREPLEPIRGYVDVGGDAPIPLDGIAFGSWLRASLGLVSNNPFVPPNLDHAAVVDLGNGLVGLPAKGHGLTPDMPILISGTQHYDGEYLVDASTTANQIVVAAAYQAEALAAGVVYLCATSLHAGDAVDLGGGKVGIPLPDHGYSAGDSVIISGTQHYNGTFPLDAATTADQLVVAQAYTAETFAPGGIVRLNLIKHVFTVGALPSFIGEEQYPDVSTFMLYTGCKVGKMGMKFGGDGEIVVTLTIMGATCTTNSTSYQDAAEEMGFARFNFDQQYIYLDGVPCEDILEFEMNLDNQNDGDIYPLGSKGFRKAINDGKSTIGGTFKAMFMDQSLIKKGENWEPTAFKTGFARDKEFLDMEMTQTKFARGGPGVPNPKGLTVDFSYQAYRNVVAQLRALTITLINQIAAY